MVFFVRDNTVYIVVLFIIVLFSKGLFLGIVVVYIDLLKNNIIIIFNGKKNMLCLLVKY